MPNARVVKYEVYESSSGKLTLVAICRCGHVLIVRHGYETRKPEVLQIDLRDLKRMEDVTDLKFWTGDESDPEKAYQDIKADPQNYCLICDGDSNHINTYRNRMGAAGRIAFEEEGE